MDLGQDDSWAYIPPGSRAGGPAWHSNYRNVRRRHGRPAGNYICICPSCSYCDMSRGEFKTDSLIQVRWTSLLLVCFEILWWRLIIGKLCQGRLVGRIDVLALKIATVYGAVLPDPLPGEYRLQSA